MSQILVRRAAQADAPVILTLLKELADYEQLTDAFRLDEARIARDMMGDPSRCELAILDGQAVGIAVWYWIYRSFRAQRGLFIDDLYVRPAHRGRGIGRRLLARLARRAGEAGAGWMEWLVLDWNAPAMDFYGRIGARPVEDWLTYRLEADAMARLKTP